MLKSIKLIQAINKILMLHLVFIKYPKENLRKIVWTKKLFMYQKNGSFKLKGF